MITKFTEYIVESRKSIEDLEMLNPDELGELLLAEVKKKSRDVRYIQDFIDVGCPINYMDSGGLTPLHYVAHWGELEIVKLLLSNGADIQAKNIEGYTALHIATVNKCFEIVELLLSNGADINARNNWDQTAWDLADDDTRDVIPELKPS